MNILRPSRRNASRSRREAFTLIEVLTAVSIGVVIILIVSRLFATAGDTVAVGKRISAFNRTASLIAQQLRDDFRDMTRDGVLVIRHAYVTDENGELILIPASPDDASPTFRRADELIFFARGQYTTRRSTLPGGSTVNAAEAMIYIGHGARADAALTADSMTLDAIARPTYDLSVHAGLDPAGGVWMGPLGGVEIASGVFAGANATASDWTLVRHVTLLVQPGLAADPGLGPEERDSRRQIDLQPAATSAFRAINLAFQTPPTNGAATFARDGSISTRPDSLSGLLVGGLIDVAATNLKEVRRRITSSHNNPPPGQAIDYINPDDFATGDDVLDPNLQPKGWLPTIDLFDGGSLTEPALPADSYLDTMHAWMRQLFPADSDGEDASLGIGPDELARVRMRAEESPPGLREVLLSTAASPFENADVLSDQNVLTGNVLAPAVTEMIIEWSFGQTDTSGAIIWYGGNDYTGAVAPPPGAPVLPTGITQYGATRLTIDRFSGEPLATELNYNGGGALDAIEPDPNYDIQHEIIPELIHGSAPRPGVIPPVYSYFGYADPTYAPVSGGQLAQTEWPWPSLIRVTFTLADPDEPSVQQQFQYVFETGR